MARASIYGERQRLLEGGMTQLTAKGPDLGPVSRVKEKKKKDGGVASMSNRATFP
jgi:hypothetical protein